MANKIVFICGSPGAGKSSVIGGITSNKNYKVVSVGSLMEEIALKNGYAKNRDELRFMPREHYDELQVVVFKKISEMEGNIILDTHATVEQNGRYMPGITFGKAGHLKRLAAFIYIDALTQDIEGRRRGDETRRREHERPELVDVQREINISILSACSAYLDLPFYVIFNEQGKLDESVKELKAHLREIFGV
jgi:adenylate kinase